ncbi:MAG: hypothetical protein CBARDCOR_3643 [uncultured Caballeronia sp.]|nr:MAG: hypothetical protein CBARDCOR_3643 [uncultured Caballeronia sp.]
MGYGTSTTYMSEVALQGWRGFLASFQYVTLIGGQLAALLVLVVLQQVLNCGHWAGASRSGSARSRRSCRCICANRSMKPPPLKPAS